MEQLAKTSELSKLYELAGVCLHLCANIEYGLAFLLQCDKWINNDAHLERLKSVYQSKSSIEEMTASLKRFDEALAIVEGQIDNLEKCTLGTLIAQLKAKHPVTEEIIKFFDAVLEKRNRLIHRIWGEYGQKLLDPKIQEEMKKELYDLQFYFKSVSDWIWEQAGKRNGVPPNK